MHKKNEINIVVAMKREALPLINYWNLKQNSKINTENLCPSILSRNAIKMQSAFINHFNELKLCNTYGLKNTSENCKKAIVGGITNEKGNVGETVLSASGAILTIHTKITSKENITNNIILSMK